MPQARVTFEHGHAKNRRVCHFKPARRGAMTGSAAAPASSSTKRLMTADRHVLRESSLALCNDFRGSVPRDERSAEAVVDARGDHVDILTDALAVIEHRAECLVIDHCDVASAHEQMIGLTVFAANPTLSGRANIISGSFAVSIEFLLTSLIVVASPGTGVLYTLAAGLSRGARASVVAAF